MIGPAPAAPGLLHKVLVETLRELGWIEGQNIVYDAAYADGDERRLPEVAAALVARRPDVIFANTSPLAQAAFGATRTIPIVFASVEGVLVQQGSVTIALKQIIARHAAAYRLPTVYPLTVFTEAGGLASYSTHILDLYRRVPAYLDKISKGAKPGELPIEQPIKFELVVNMKTAKALGVTMPQSILLQADRVIE